MSGMSRAGRTLRVYLEQVSQYIRCILSVCVGACVPCRVVCVVVVVVVGPGAAAVRSALVRARARPRSEAASASRAHTRIRFHPPNSANCNRPLKDKQTHTTRTHVRQTSESGEVHNYSARCVQRCAHARF